MHFPLLRCPAWWPCKHVGFFVLAHLVVNTVAFCHTLSFVRSGGVLLKVNDLSRSAAIQDAPVSVVSSKASESSTSTTHSSERTIVKRPRHLLQQPALVFV